MSRPLPRYRPDENDSSDPVDRWIAERRAEKERARQRVDDGQLVGDPAELRGIPVQAKGVGGTSPGTNPATEVVRNDHRLRRSS